MEEHMKMMASIGAGGALEHVPLDTAPPRKRTVWQRTGLKKRRLALHGLENAPFGCAQSHDAPQAGDGRAHEDDGIHRGGGGADPGRYGGKIRARLGTYTLNLNLQS